MEFDLLEAVKRVNNNESMDKVAKEYGFKRDALRSRFEKGGFVREDGKKNGKWILKALDEIAITKASTSKSKNGIITEKATSKDDNVKSDIKALIQGTNKKKDDRLQRNFYADRDIADFLDNIPFGNKSELINKIIRAYLIDNGLI